VKNAKNNRQRFYYIVAFKWYPISKLSRQNSFIFCDWSSLSLRIRIGQQSVSSSLRIKSSLRAGSATMENTKTVFCLFPLTHVPVSLTWKWLDNMREKRKLYLYNDVVALRKIWRQFLNVISHFWDLRHCHVTKFSCENVPSALKSVENMP
jgi:hypothetical protein